MSWLFSQALVEEYLEDTSSDGEPSAPLNGNPIPQAYCAPDKMTGFSRLSRFGMTFKPLTESRGEELLTWFLAGFPARTSALRGGGAGITGSRSSMWKHMARIIGEVRPQYAFIENSPMLTIRGLETVLCDLAALGFNARWGVVSAADVGAPHLRERIWIRAEQRNFLPHANDRGIGRGEQQSESTQETHGKLADTSKQGLERKQRQKSERNGMRFANKSKKLANTNSAHGKGNECTQRTQPKYADVSGSSWWAVEPNVGRVANGVAARMDRLKAIGNGQVPRVAATAWRLLNE